MNVINLAKDLYKNYLLITKDRNITDINNYIKNMLYNNGSAY